MQTVTPPPHETATADARTAIPPRAPCPVPRHGWWALGQDVVRATADIVRRRPPPPSGREVDDFGCALCQGTEARERFAHDIPAAPDHTVVQCSRCHLAVTHPPPPLAEIPGLYGAAYYGVENAKFGKLTELFVGLFRRARLRALRLMRVPTGDVLDLGCARGLFLQALESRGYRGFGTELSEHSARAARKRLGDERVHIGGLQSAGFDDAQFVAITAWQVFEHLPDPAATLRECHRILRPGGALLLAVPNIDSWQARWAGAEWFHLDVPRHLYHYSPDTLRRLLEQHGFEVEHTSHHNLEQNPFGLLQSALHRLGRPHLGLYDVLRGKLDPSRRSLGQRLWRYGAYLAMFPFAAAVSFAWSAFGRGATFTVLARRT